MGFKRDLMVAGAILAAGGCSDDGNQPATGSYSAEVSGAYQGTFSGEAYFGVLRELGELGFTLVLGDADPVRVVLQSDGTAQSPAGSYELVAPDFPQAGGNYRGTVGLVQGNALEQFEIRGGTLVIEESNTGRLRGTVELRAERTFPCCDPVPIQLFLTASFDAQALER